MNHLQNAIATLDGKTATVVTETWDKVDMIIEILGERGFIESYIRAEEDFHANEILDYIIQTHDLVEYFPGEGPFARE